MAQSATSLSHIDDEAITYMIDDMTDSHRGYAHGPERALMSALLFDGLQSYMSYVLSGTKNKNSRFREAFNWVNDKTNDYVFSFDNVCEGLGIDPEFLRIGLSNASHSQREVMSKSRRHF